MVQIGNSEAGRPALHPRDRDPAPGAATFRREGEYWSIEFDGGESFRVRDSKGMRHLARLLASPGGARSMPSIWHDPRRVARTMAIAMESPDLMSDALGDAGPVLDAEAPKSAYRQRLVDIRSELAEAK